MRDRRSGLSADERVRAAAAAAARLAALPELRAAVAGRACIVGFVAARGEIDPAVVLDQARGGGARVALPRVPPQQEEEQRDTDRGPRLRFHLAGGAAVGGDLRPGRFGIQEPDASSPEVRAGDAAVMIVPGLAFDGTGHRLGAGGGYYDEVLMTPGRPRPGLVVGLGYDFQVVDACPAGGEDALVDCIVTDARVIRCAGSPGPGAPGVSGGGRGGEAGA